MAELKRVGDLELEEDLRFQQWEWRASRVTWFLLLAIMVATGLGLFGSGVLVRVRAGEAGSPLWVEYNSVARFGASVRMTVHALPRADGSVRFVVGRSLLEALRVQHVTPAPASTTILGDGVEYRFQTAASETTPVIFEMQPATRWTVEGYVRTADETVEVTQLILP